MKQLKQSKKTTQVTNQQAGVFSSLGVSLLILLVFATIGFVFWVTQRNQTPTLVYTPPAVTADTPLTAGKSTKEITQDLKVLEASVKRGDALKAKASEVLEDKVYTGSSSLSSADLQQESISAQQTTFIKESNRRIQTLTKAQPTLDKLTSSQRPTIEEQLNDEVTLLNDLKSKIVTITTQDGITAQQQALNDEYSDYLLTIAQINLLAWANDQSTMAAKFNKVGGKFQERADAASNAGRSIVSIQTLLNSYQANKLTARDSTAEAIKIIPTIQSGDIGASRSVFKTYVNSLSTAHNELTKAFGTAKKLLAQMQQLDKSSL